MHTNQSAQAANKILAQERLHYQSTTAPLNSIHDTLKDVKNLLSEILEILRKRI